MDLVFPNKNEQELANELEKLGFQEVIFAYDKPTNFKINTKLKITKALILNNRRKIFDNYLLIGSAKREFFEDKRIKGIIGLGLNDKPDKTHFRRSLTQVDCVLAKNKTFFFNLQDLINTKNKPLLLGRWFQDIKLFKKYKNEFYLISGAKNIMQLRSKKDLEVIKEF